LDARGKQSFEILTQQDVRDGAAVLAPAGLFANLIYPGVIDDLI